MQITQGKKNLVNAQVKSEQKTKYIYKSFGTSPKAIERKTQTIFCKEKANETFSLSVANET